MLAPQRILYMSHTGRVSGAERVLLHMLSVVERSQYEPVVMCPADGDLAAMVRAAGFECVPMPAVQARFSANPLRILRAIASVAATALATRRQIRNMAPRGIHANTVRAGIIATLATFGLRTPVLWHVHDDLPRRNPISTCIRLLAFLTHRSHVVGVSNYTTGTFCGRLDFGTRAETLHNGIDTDRFPRRYGVDPSFKRELGLPEDAFLCATIGITTPRKGLDGLITAIEILRDKATNIYLVDVGDAVFPHDIAYRKSIIARVQQLGLQDRIRFVGYRRDVPEILRGVDLVILNSTSDPAALILCEAMAAGVPVLAAPAGGSVEILDSGRFGWMLDDFTPRTLAQTLIDLAAQPARLQQHVEAAHQRIVSTYSYAAYRNAFAELYARVFPVHKVAIFHDSFSQQGGAERVAEVLYQTFPGAELYTTLTVPSKLSPILRKAHPHTTWMQWLPFKARIFRAYFMLYPAAVEHTDLSAYDLVVTSCTGYSKGVHRREGALHICYCHNPMRWIHRTNNYLEQEKFGRWKARILRLGLKPLRDWERAAARRPDYFIANSAVVRQRLHDAFGVEATVINPPINVSRFAISNNVEDYYLVLSRLIPYKRIDLAVEACTRTGRKLVIIGDGRDRARLESLAGPTVTFLGRVEDEVVNDYAARCRALLFTGEEDFGMTPLEVNAAGRPTIAFHAGGATETVIDGLNGIFFNDPTVESLQAAIERFETMTWDPQAIRRHALQYDTAVFQSRLRDFVRQVSGLPSGESSANRLAALLVNS
jgi:glycosyltransferase involved in cell wall biosynthesis